MQFLVSTILDELLNYIILCSENFGLNNSLSVTFMQAVQVVISVVQHPT